MMNDSVGYELPIPDNNNNEYNEYNDDNDDNNNDELYNSFNSRTFISNEDDFFQVGRDFEPSHVTHKFSESEKRRMQQFETVDYIEPQNTTLKTYIETSTEPKAAQKWLCFALIGLCVGLTAFVLKQTIEALIHSRVKQVEKFFEEDKNFSAYIYFLFHSIVLVMISTGVVAWCPKAAGSGIPEVMGYLNGVHIKKIFNIRTVIAKFVSCIFAVASGLPVGPEGPMISLGAALGAGISQGRSKTLGFNFDVFRELRNSRDKRDSITCGAAAGVSAAFSAPLGGLLFAMEEVSSFWGTQLTWMIFFGSMMAAFTINLFASAFDKWEYTGEFGFFDDNSTILFQQDEIVRFNVLAVPAVLLIGALNGVLGAVFTFANLKVTRFRSMYINGKLWRRVLEPIIIITIFATLMFTIPYMFDCRDKKAALHSENVETFNFNCKEETQFHPMATLTIGSGDNAIRHMFTRRLPHLYNYGEILIMFVLYFTFACYTAGSSVSSGLVVPMLLIGSLNGRFVGLMLVDIFGSGHPWLDPGVFALIGAGAFFGGVSRLTVSLTVIMLEISDEIHLLLPIMFSIMTAKWVADFVTHSLYHALLEVKCVPFLDSESVVPKLECFSAATVMSPNIVCLKDRIKVADAIRLLNDTKHNAFPVVESTRKYRLNTGLVHNDNKVDEDEISTQEYDEIPDTFQQKLGHVRNGLLFHGTILRSQIQMLLNFPENFIRSAEDSTHVISYEQQREYWNTKHKRKAPTIALNEDVYTREDDTTMYLDLRPYVNTSAVSVNADFSLSIAYTLFRSLGLRHLVVVDGLNRPVGMITRKDLIGQTIEEKIELQQRQRIL